MIPILLRPGFTGKEPWWFIISYAIAVTLLALLCVVMLIRFAIIDHDWFEFVIATMFTLCFIGASVLTWLAIRASRTGMRR